MMFPKREVVIVAMLVFKVRFTATIVLSLLKSVRWISVEIVKVI
jgi:hypothetical protein